MIELLIVLKYFNKTSLLKHEISQKCKPFKEELTPVHLSKLQYKVFLNILQSSFHILVYNYVSDNA